MSDPSSKSDKPWNERAVEWAKGAPETVSADDEPNQRLIAAAGISPGDRVLDLASGTGDPAISIALRVGATGSVHATDPTRAMLDVARGRAARMALANIAFEDCAMEGLPFDDAAFDAVTCRFGIMHAADALPGLRQALRVLRPGRRAAFMVHGPSAHNTVWTTVHTVAPAFLGIDRSAGFERHFRYSGAGEVAALFEQAGFVDVREEDLRREVRKPGDAVFWERVLERGYGTEVAALSADRRADLHEQLRTAFSTHLSGGAYVLENAQKIVSGAAP